MDNILYKGRFINVEKVKHEEKNYEAVILDNAVAVLVLNQDKSKMLLVKQYRPVYGDYTYEIPAGMLDVEGESDKLCAVRELEEEANIKIFSDDLNFLLTYFPAIGFTSHKLNIYYAIIEENDDKEIKNDDVVERIWISLDDFQSMIKDGKIVDGKTLLAYYSFLSKDI